MIEASIVSMKKTIVRTQCATETANMRSVARNIMAFTLDLSPLCLR